MRGWLIICATLIVSALEAQFNPLYTQYARNPFVINPASAGEQGFMSATLSARKQWVGFNGAPETYAFSIHTPVKSLHHNFGLIAVQDNMAVVHRTEVSVSYAYRILTPKFNFAAGISPLAELFSNRWSEVQTNTSGDPAFATVSQYLRYGMSYGVYGNTRRLFFGVSHRILTSTETGLIPQPFMLLSGVRFGSEKKVLLTVSSLGRMLRGKYVQADVNVFLIYKNRIGAGIGYRFNDALTGQFSVKVNGQFSVGYSYDYTISSLRNYSGGSHELLLRYDFGYTVNRPDPLFR